MRALSLLRITSTVVLVLCVAFLLGAFYVQHLWATVNVHAASGGVDPIALDKRNAYLHLGLWLSWASVILLGVNTGLSLWARQLTLTQGERLGWWWPLRR